MNLNLVTKHRQAQKRAREYSLALRAAAADPLDKWLSDSRVFYFTPEVPITKANPQYEVLVNIWMSHQRGEVEGDYRDPDSFTMWMQVETPWAAGLDITRSPMVRLAHYLGSRDDGDAPAWLELIKGENYSFVQAREWMAKVLCGLSDLWVGDVVNGTRMKFPI
ncbi:hypothetical protein DFH07DRAFT_112822 [Mycena maculata]|uniref:Uncharacterized protein n=1 Tax=Mycena maculata TaxID=230809 RepID=A0AAD7MW97_9AGAR|nr:hypothetical protein DFH07DRAFT_112822 [Mycena maculata]